MTANVAQEFSRTQRIADYLRRELAALIQREVGDPRVGMVAVTDVEVSRDLAHAKVFVNLVGERDAAGRDAALQALNHASGYLRSLIARQVQWRTTPRLRFLHDDSVQQGAHLSALIDRAVAEDRRHNPGEDD